MLNYQIHLQLGQELIKLKIIHLTHTWYNRICIVICLSFTINKIDSTTDNAQTDF